MSIFQMYFRTHIKNAFRTTSILLFFNQFQKWIATKTSAFFIHAYISIFIFLPSAVWFHSFIIYLQENFIIILHFHINFLKKKKKWILSGRTFINHKTEWKLKMHFLNAKNFNQNQQNSMSKSKLQSNYLSDSNSTKRNTNIT